MTSSAAPREATYFQYFPDSFRWSSALNGILNTAASGGSDMGEIDRAGRYLLQHVNDEEAWFSAWSEAADRVAAQARSAEAAGHRFTAATFNLRACNYLQWGERFAPERDERALDAYRRSVGHFHRFIELTDRPRMEIVEVPYEDGSLPAYFVHAENAAAERTPCVVFFDGLDVTKEIQFLRGVSDLIRRGISCLLVDGPGTGEAIRFRGYHLRYDYEVAGSAALDYLETRNDVDPNRIGIMAISLGGYYAPRCAAMDQRFKACAAWGAIWDYHETWAQRIEAGSSGVMSAPSDHIMWILGVDSIEEALKRLEPFKLDGVVQKLRCPFVLTHGEHDRQVKLADAHALFNAVGSEDKTLKIFTTEDGGHQHCQSDYLSLGNTFIFDWMSDKL